MGIASLILGILSLPAVCLSLIPLLNLLNCITLPVAMLGLILGIVDLARRKPAGKSNAPAILGVIFNSLALVIGVVRFLISLFTTGGIV